MDTMLAEISYRATRLHAIQFGAHFRTRDSFPEITYDSTHHVYQDGQFVQRTPGRKRKMKGEGDFEEQQYYAMGFNKYDLSDPLYDSKWKKLLRDEFWDKALPVTFVPEVPKPAGPPYMMYTYNSSAKAVKDQIMGKEFLEYHSILLFNQVDPCPGQLQP